MARYQYDKELKKVVKISDDNPTDHNKGLNGPIYCPEGGYFDPVLNRRFETKNEKRAYMREKGLKMHGSDSPKELLGTGKKTLYFYPK